MNEISFQLKPEVEKALIKINFVKRYESLSKSSRNIAINENLKDISNDAVTNIINDLGYNVIYDKKEKFFKVGLVEDLPKYKMWFNILLRSGVVEFIWVVYHNEDLILGTPWSVYPRILVSTDTRIKPPLYSNELELKKILSTSLEMYEDFKREIIQTEGRFVCND